MVKQARAVNVNKCNQFHSIWHLPRLGAIKSLTFSRPLRSIVYRSFMHSIPLALYVMHLVVYIWFEVTAQYSAYWISLTLASLYVYKRILNNPFAWPNLILIHFQPSILTLSNSKESKKICFLSHIACQHVFVPSVFTVASKGITNKCLSPIVLWSDPPPVC